jgi:hypothetical protein
MAGKIYTKTWVRVTIICALGAAVISGGAAIMAALLGKEPSVQSSPFPARTDITITSPKNGETVDKSFTIRGRTKSIESREVHAWAAIEIGELLWIKEPEIRIEDRFWKSEIVEGGSASPGSFSLLLVGVTVRGQQYITQWIAQCKRTGSWPGIRINDIPGAAVLDRVDNLKFK